MDALRILVLEVEATEHAGPALDAKDLIVHRSTADDGRCRVALGFAFVRGTWVPKYLPAAAADQVG